MPQALAMGWLYVLALVGAYVYATRDCTFLLPRRNGQVLGALALTAFVVLLIVVIGQAETSAEAAEYARTAVIRAQ